MKLTDLDPRWVGSGGDGVTQNGHPVPRREGVGLTCNCPCGCDSPMYVPFENPLDGGPRLQADPHPCWQRTGDTFETLTLTPSIQRRKVNEYGCEWHGFITNGEAIRV